MGARLKTSSRPATQAGRSPKKATKPEAIGRAGTPAPRAGRVALRSTVTARAQTTLPSGVRQALGIEAGDKLEYVIHGEEAVIRKAAAQDEADPAMGAFLAFLARDIGTHPERLTSLPPALREEIERLTHGAVIDHDEPLDGAVAL